VEGGENEAMNLSFSKMELSSQRRPLPPRGKEEEDIGVQHVRSCVIGEWCSIAPHKVIII
jgi:hypothetical protein